MKILMLILAALVVAAGTVTAIATQDASKMYFLSLHYKSEELYMAMNSIELMEGYPADYRTGGDWYFQLIDRKQRVLEEKHFSFTTIFCVDFEDEHGQWSGGCEAQEETDLIMEIPYHRNAWMITVYDGQGFVRFGPYDVSEMQPTVEQENDEQSSFQNGAAVYLQFCH